MNEPLNYADVEISELTSSSSDDAEWVGGFFAYGGAGAASSTVIYFAVPPGKRLGRHTDTAEETQFIVSGSGELLLDDGPRPIRAGDVVWIPPGVKHWHGAAPTTGMTHVATSEAQDGKTVDWLEHVTDEQYRR